MEKTKKLESLLKRKSRLEERLFNEQQRQHERIDRMGWGYGMRHSKIGFSTRKEDEILARLEEVNNEIKLLQTL